jgi:hypothetical protein
LFVCLQFSWSQSQRKEKIKVAVKMNVFSLQVEQ